MILRSVSNLRPWLAGAVYAVSFAANVPSSSADCAYRDDALPVDKLACHLFETHNDKAASDDTKTRRTPCVLVACGSFNPPTLMHLRMFEAARARLHQQGYDVLGGYVSPVNDAYGKPGLATAADRVALCEAAVSTSPWIMTDAWEARQSGYQRTLVVLRSIQARLLSAFNVASEDVAAPHVMLLCGTDMLESFARPGVWLDDQLRDIFCEHGVVVVTRPGGNLPALMDQEGSVLNRYRDHIITVDDVVSNPLSSTVVRHTVKQGLPLKYLVPDEVAKMIEDRALYSAA